MATTDAPSAPYGFCPICGSPGRLRERRLDGNDVCEKHHSYPSKDALPEPLKQHDTTANSKPSADEMTPDGAFHQKIDSLQDSLAWYCEGMKISDPLKRLEHWEPDLDLFSRLTALFIAEGEDMKCLSGNLATHNETLAKCHKRRIDLRLH